MRRSAERVVRMRARESLRVNRDVVLLSLFYSDDGVVNSC